MTALLESGTESRRSVAPGRDPRPLVFPVGVVLVAWLLMRLGGVDSLQAARVVLVVGVQVVTGVALWRLARGPVTTYATELLGMGAALGTLTSLLGAQLLRATPLGAVGWLLPTALTGLALALAPVRRRMRSGTTHTVSSDEAGALALGVGTGMAFIGPFWRAHPLDPIGWWSYYVDITYHEALSTSLATWGPGESIFVAGEPIRYHWFAHAWAGATTDATAAESFVVMTRALPLVALIGTVALVWAWSRRMSDHAAVPVVAVLVTTLGMNVASLLPVNFQQLIVLSPSLGLGALWLLGAALVFTEHLRYRVRGGLLLLALLAVGCVGGKTSNAAALLGGIGLAAVAAWSRPGLRGRAWAALGVALLAVAGAFAALISGSSGDVTLELGRSARTFGFTIAPTPSLLAIAVGTLGVGLVYAAKWGGLLPLVVDRRTAARPEVWFGLGSAAAGLFLMAVLGHPGSSQLYFVASSGLLVGVVSAWGLGEAAGELSRSVLLLATGAGVGSAALGLVALPDRLAWSAPYVVWFPPLLLAAAVVVRALARSPRGFRTGVLVPGATVLACGLVAASVATGWTSAGNALRAGAPASPGAHAPNAWTPSHEEALVWLRENSSEDDVVMTNRQCSHVQHADGCGYQRWFLTAALGERRMYVEGADYAAGLPHPEWVDERAELSRRFVDSPNRADAEVLWEAGVRWVVVDVASTGTLGWAPFAEPAYTNDVTVVLRLLRP